MRRKMFTTALSLAVMMYAASVFAMMGGGSSNSHMGGQGYGYQQDMGHQNHMGGQYQDHMNGQYQDHMYNGNGSTRNSGRYGNNQDHMSVQEMNEVHTGDPEMDHENMNHDVNQGMADDFFRE